MTDQGCILLTGATGHVGGRLRQVLEAKAEAAAEEPSPEQRPKYITNYIGSKQKLVDWIWQHTPDGVESAADAFSGSAVVAYRYNSSSPVGEVRYP